jgi:hypothetical protein
LRAGFGPVSGAGAGDAPRAPAKIFVNVKFLSFWKASLSKFKKYAKLKEIEYAGKKYVFAIKPGKNTKNHQAASKQNEDRG